VSHNALVWINPHNSDWDNIANITGDQTWAASNMLQYLSKAQEWITTEMVDPVSVSETGRGASGTDDARRIGSRMMISTHSRSTLVLW
jgi:hypothetical protein